MDSHWPGKSFCQTPISTKKRFQKLSLRKGYPSNSTQFIPEKILHEGQYGNGQDQSDKKTPCKSLSPFYAEDNFDTPPFVTKSRPKYKNSSCSTPHLSDDFIGNTPDMEDNDVSQVRNTPVASYTQQYNMFDTFHQNDKFNLDQSKKTSIEDVQYGLDVRLNESGNNIGKYNSIMNDFQELSTPRNLCINKLSPKSANIMSSLYGDVWKKTPGLFKKRQSMYRIQSINNESRTNDNSPIDVNIFDVNINTLDKSNDSSLKPKMLSFDDGDECRPLNSNITPPNSNKSDSLFSFKRVRKKKMFSSSSSNDSGDENPKIKDWKITSDSDKEYEISDEEVISDVIRTNIVRVENDLECSVILIETDTETTETIGKTDKKIRKLFSKHNNNFDDVEFISENPPRPKIKENRVFEIIDDNVEDVYVVKHKDNVNFDILSDNIQRISLKETTVKPNKDVKKVKDKPIHRRNKKENIPQVKTHDIDLDNLEVYGFMASLSDTIPSWRCDKEAKYYKDKFKSKKVELTQKLFKMYNENVYSGQLDINLPISWSSTLNTTAGRAYNKIKKSKTGGGNIKSSSVELSIKVLDSAQRLRDTLAHELCHVAAWMIDGQLRDGHGPYWKKWVSKTLQVFPELGNIPVCHTLSIHYKYTFKCTRCGYGINRHSKSIDVTRKACGYCGGRFECIHNKKNKDGLVVSTPVKRTSRELKGFALYVKENYGNVRGSNTPHKQAMQYLGKQYAKMKATLSSDDGQGKGN